MMFGAYHCREHTTRRSENLEMHWNISHESSRSTCPEMLWKVLLWDIHIMLYWCRICGLCLLSILICVKYLNVIYYKLLTGLTLFSELYWRTWIEFQVSTRPCAVCCTAGLPRRSVAYHLYAANVESCLRWSRLRSNFKCIDYFALKDWLMLIVLVYLNWLCLIRSTILLTVI